MIRFLPMTHYIPTFSGLVSNVFRREAVFPFYASFKITSRCHFGCPFCNMKNQQTEDLSTKEVKKILDTLSKSPVLLTSFEGGEPLLRDDIGELLKYARKCKFYLLFTTSVRDILDYPMGEYAKYIDFLHISMDEGHNNLEMYDLLPDLVKLPTQVSVQTVVTDETVSALDEKVEKCHMSGANIVVIPASPMKDAKHCFPDIDLFADKLIKLRKKYPSTIHTPQGYFNAYKKGKCSSASVIIAPDGKLFYPCHILEEKPLNLLKTDLTAWLKTKDAAQYRKKMKTCDINCGWYQYYSIDSYLSPVSIKSALDPIFVKK